jgi:uncharacterized membrane protein YfcA
MTFPISPAAVLANAWAWPSLTPTQWAMAALAGLCCGIAKAGLAGVGMMTVLIMADIFPGKLSSGVVLPLLIFADVMAALLYRQEIHWGRIRALIWPILMGIVLGWGILWHLPDAAFKPLIGAMILLMLGVQIFRGRAPQLTGRMAGSPAFTWGAGLLTGLSTMVANAAGPIATIYLLILGLPKREFVATMAWLFLFVNLVKVPFSLHLGLISGGSLTLNLLLVPTVLAGLFLGRAAVHRLPQRPFQIIVLSLAALAALRLLFIA